MEAVVMTSSKDPESPGLSLGSPQVIDGLVESKNRTKDPDLAMVTAHLKYERDARAGGRTLAGTPRSLGQSAKRVYLARGLPGRIACPFRTSPPEVLITWSVNGSLIFENQNGAVDDDDDNEDENELASEMSSHQTPLTYSVSSSSSSSSLGGLVVYQHNRQNSAKVRNNLNQSEARLREVAQQSQQFQQQSDQRPQQKGPKQHNVTFFRDLKIPINRVRVTKEGHLKFKVVLDEDEGMYACNKYSPFSVTTRNASYFKVLVREVPRLLKPPSHFYQSRPGLTVTLVCVAIGDPKPSVVWRKLDGEFPPINRTLQEEGNLTLARVTFTDQGHYECRTFNFLGMTYSRTVLIVEDGKTHGPTNVTVTTSSTSMTVSWYPAYNSNTSEPEYCHYLIWYRIPGDNHTEPGFNWTTLLPPQNTSNVTVQMHGSTFTIRTTTTTTIYDLPPSTPFEVRVMSRDAEDRHQFSEIALARTKGRIRLKDGKKTKNNTSAALDGTPAKADSSPRNPSEWRRPRSPKNLTAILKNGGLLLSWQPPPPLYFRLWRPEVGSRENVSTANHDALSTLPSDVIPGQGSTPGDRKPEVGSYDHHHYRHHHHHHHHISPQTNSTDGTEANMIPEVFRIPASHCVVEYKTLGRWLTLSGKLNSNLTQFFWSTVSKGTVYHFRVVCYYYAPKAVVRKGSKSQNLIRGSYSEEIQLSTEVPIYEPAVRMSNAKVGGVIFVVMVTLFALSSAPFLVKYLKNLRKKTSRGLEYVCAKHGAATGNNLQNSTTTTLSTKAKQQASAAAWTARHNATKSNDITPCSNHISLTHSAVSSQSLPPEYIEVEASV